VAEKFNTGLKHSAHFLLAVTITLAACSKTETSQTNPSNINGLKTQSLQEQAPEAKRSASPIPIKDEELEDPPEFPLDKSSILNGRHKELEKEELGYNNGPLPELSVDSYDEHGIVPGQVQLVFKNGQQVKISRSDAHNILIENDGLASTKAFKDILDNFKVVDGYDLGQGMAPSEIEAEKKRLENHYKGYIPSRSAIQNYTFPKNTDLVSLIKKLRSLSSIHSANFAFKVKRTYTKYQLSSISNNGTGYVSTGSPPYDTLFLIQPESSSWWWYNRHKIFLAWYQFTAAMPTIAIIDSGFDTDPSAFDLPNYTGAVSITNCSAVGLSNCSDVAYGNAAVQEPTGNTVSVNSHGAMVAAVAGAPKDNNLHMAGVAPGAPIMPIRVMVPYGEPGCTDPATDQAGCLNENAIATGIRYATAQSSVDVINLSLGIGDCPASLGSNVIRTEIAAAITAGKIVVASAGNIRKNLQPGLSGGFGQPFDPANDAACGFPNLSAGEIIVGGLEDDTSQSTPTTSYPPRTQGWDDGSGLGSNYDRYYVHTYFPAPSFISLAAAAKNIFVPKYNPNTGYRTEGLEDGTSFASPMVAAVAGMMKKAGQAASPSVTYTPAQIKSILIGTADISRYSIATTNSSAETRFLGPTPGNNSPTMLGALSLNALNAIVVAKKLSSYQAIVRIHNIDDSLRATVNNDWNFYMYDGFGQDALWGLGGLSSGNKINFRLYNTGGGISYGYTVFRSSQLSDFTASGVSGISGADYNATKGLGWWAYYDYTY
jgi:hypothetical protein